MPYPTGDEDFRQRPGKRRRTANGAANHGDSRPGESSSGSHTRSDGSSGSSLRAIFDRVVERRRREVAGLAPGAARALLVGIREETGKGLPSLAAAEASAHRALDAEAASTDVLGLVETEYETIRNEALPPDERRRSWDVVGAVFRLIDGFRGRNNPDQQEAGLAKGRDAPGVVQNNTGAIGRASHDGNKKANGNNDSRNSNNSSNNNNSNGSKNNGQNGINNTGATSVAASAQTSAPTSKKTPPLSNARPTAQKSAVPATAATPATEKNGGNVPEKSSRSQQAATTNHQNRISKAATRTVASLSSASASTMATALSSTSSSVTNHATRNNTTGARAPSTAPVGRAPPPYEKRSATTQHHKAQKQLEQQQRLHPEANTHASARERQGSQASKQTRAATKTVATMPGKNGATNPHANKTNESASAAKAARMRTAAQSSTSAATAAAFDPPSQPATAASAISRSFSSVSTSNSASLPSAPIQDTAANTSSPENDSLDTAVAEQPIPTSKTSEVSLPADDSTQKPTIYGCFMEDRPQVSLKFRQHTPTKNMAEHFLKRLKKWDPYWKIENSLHVGLTAPVMEKRWMRKTDKVPDKYFPNTAGFFTIKNLLKTVGPRIRQVGASRAPRNGELRVLIRMLPLDLSKQEYAGKNRADLHIWPKGTFLQLHAAPSTRTKPRPLQLRQRKQQSHCFTKWLGICNHLDVTSLLHSAWSSTTTSLNASSDTTVQLGCYDPELYFFSVALCRYQEPKTIVHNLMNAPRIPHGTAAGEPAVRMVKIEEMHNRARRKMENNNVLLLDDSDDEDGGNQSKANAPEELRRILFSIRDPLAMGVLTTPVRGRRCLHVSCFDLNSFLHMNKSASGQRWKCGYCENFISYEDLEHCPLTEKAVKLFGSEVTNLQHMVEFKEDKSMSFCKRVKTHQERAKAKKAAAALTNTHGGNPAIAGGGANDVVDLLDSDSE